MGSSLRLHFWRLQTLLAASVNTYSIHLPFSCPCQTAGLALLKNTVTLKFFYEVSYCLIGRAVFSFSVLFFFFSFSVLLVSVIVCSSDSTYLITPSPFFLSLLLLNNNGLPQGFIFEILLFFFLCLS